MADFDMPDDFVARGLAAQAVVDELIELSGRVDLMAPWPLHTGNLLIDTPFTADERKARDELTARLIHLIAVDRRGLRYELVAMSALAAAVVGVYQATAEYPAASPFSFFQSALYARLRILRHARHGAEINALRSMLRALEHEREAETRPVERHRLTMKIQELERKISQRESRLRRDVFR